MKTSYPASTFGNMYRQALQSQLQKMGTTLSLLRKTRQEDIDSVAAAINLRPEILQQIENGRHDFRFKTLFALCEYYNIDIESIVGQGELLHFKLV
jgi:transcriptional regulator with XRE-family HTH domain